MMNLDLILLSTIELVGRVQIELVHLIQCTILTGSISG